ncbi:hypothetical protein HPB50_000806 [Hyalomma asiaticum]|uniref:Uncharacterized protein n=1 Tax=Hyalomma asiaticum TaxID=266040 RepID=A0ACB7SIT4_HYAAI|nr:hypothetical protein HPB50_000806 [Hyalomma asiaticum]
MSATNLLASSTLCSGSLMRQYVQQWKIMLRESLFRVWPLLFLPRLLCGAAIEATQGSFGNKGSPSRVTSLMGSMAEKMGRNAVRKLTRLHTPPPANTVPLAPPPANTLPLDQTAEQQQILWSLQELLLSHNSHKVSPTTELGYHKQSLHREEALFHCEVAEQDTL